MPHNDNHLEFPTDINENSQGGSCSHDHTGTITELDMEQIF
jgi:hypothetical protein